MADDYCGTGCVTRGRLGPPCRKMCQDVGGPCRPNIRTPKPAAENK